MTLSGLGIALSIVFGCLLLGIIGELYYLLFWKRRRSHTEIQTENSNNPKGFLYRVCWSTPSSVQNTNTPRRLNTASEIKIHEPDLELGNSKDVLLKNVGEEGVESELMRLHNLAGPPRFLFTIKEETKEDLESEDGKSRGDRSRKGSRTRSLSDLMVAIDTPYLTPHASSPLKSPLNSLDSYKHQGFNPLFESLGESEFSRVRSSPPPKFKFLRDAEEKLYKRLIEEAQRKGQYEIKNSNYSTVVTDGREGSSLSVTKNKERELPEHIPQFPSSTSQVLPLTSSPTTFRPLEQASTVR